MPSANPKNLPISLPNLSGPGVPKKAERKKCQPRHEGCDHNDGDDGDDGDVCMCMYVYV